MIDYAALLDSGGPLARALPGFSTRPEQQRMAEAVGAALEGTGKLLVEAGTGTGKTLAYLVPALAWGGKVIVSTGTKTLQEQLYFRDVPLVRDALGTGGDVSLLKGRSNYLCLHRLGLAEEAGAASGDDGRLATIRSWSRRTRAGDIAELDALGEADPVWGDVTSTTDNCLGSECPAFDECFVYRARRAALEADVVVVNHHLLFADAALRSGGHGELLPGADAVILDEAHQVPGVAAQFFGTSVSARQMLELVRDLRAERTRGADTPEGAEAQAALLEQSVREARLAFGAGGGERAPWHVWEERRELVSALRRVAGALDALAAALETGSGRSPGLESCHRRSLELSGGISAMLSTPSADEVQWAETTRQGFILHRTPLDVAPAMRAVMEQKPCAWVFTSATLAVDGRFDHIASRLGAEDADTLLLDSPFDFRSRTLMYRPAGMPEPGAADYGERVAEAAVPAIRAAGGGAFFLFTSHRALRDAAGRLDGELEYPLLVQGDAPRGDLIRRFREYGNAVLLGTSSFWEGVDVRGPALGLVIIDRLPFAAPGDPVLQARLDALRRAGRNPFRDYQLPEAVLGLKQGVGRLIRDAGDHGVIMLCDPRLESRGYGRVFLDSLPGMPVTRDIADVEAFFARLGRARMATEPTEGHGTLQ